jgi:hypothetical protein
VCLDAISENETTVHFECAPTDIMCIGYSCTVIQLLEAHRIIIAGIGMTNIVIQRYTIKHQALHCRANGLLFPREGLWWEIR